jgi:hypothetical protein
MNRALSIIVLLTFIFGGSTVCAQAGMSAKEAIEGYRKGDAAASKYLEGLADGFSAANADAENANAMPLFCEPNRAPVPIDRQVDVLAAFVARAPDFIGAVASQDDDGKGAI